MATCSRCGAASGEETRFCAIAAPLRPAAAGSQVKVVTILFCDLVESTKLAERFDRRSMISPCYFVGARTIVERHGGTVEKFIGDAVCAVFGMPVVREDHLASGGVRAAVERDAVVSLDGQLGSPGSTRIGANTGEVFAAEPTCRSPGTRSGRRSAWRRRRRAAESCWADDLDACARRGRCRAAAAGPAQGGSRSGSTSSS